MTAVTTLPFLYGTAWKEEATERLTRLALACGFRGIDTANQRKHYFEAAVGRAVQAAIADGEVTRDALFLQTKYTFRGGQDHRLPYDPAAPIATQVVQSIDSSLEHFGCKAVDSLILHGPANYPGLGDEDWEAWRAMERLVDEGKTRVIGLSNVSADQLKLFLDGARIAPAYVQNRCYARTGWDHEVRRLCRDAGATYQPFSLLTANRTELASDAIRALAKQHGATIPQLVFRFAQRLGMLPLTGTTNAQHMREDLACTTLPLDDATLRTIESIGTS